MEMPDAEKTDVEADKGKAYSKEDLANKQKEKSRAMNTLGEYMPGIDVYKRQHLYCLTEKSPKRTCAN